MIHVVDFEKTAFSTPFRGVLPSSGPQIIAENGMGYPLLGTRETWLAPNVLAGSMTTGFADRSEIGQIDRNRRRRGCAGARDTNSAPPRLTTPLSQMALFSPRRTAQS